ncbi:LuxR C-terminal-related transcriptional regulator [Jatrophihabitans fulvus]
MNLVLVVDDHELIATALCVALRSQEIPAEHVAPRPLPELLPLLLDRKPDVVLLDLDLGDHGDSTGLVGPLTDAGARVVLVSGSGDRLRIAAALEQGARAYRSKLDGLTRLVDTVRAVLLDDRPLDVHLRVELLDELRRGRAERTRTLRPFAQLTDREAATLRELCDGRSAREIADLWVVSEPTVRTHIRAVLSKLEVSSQLAAVAMAVRSGWFTAAMSRSA